LSAFFQLVVLIVWFTISVFICATMVLWSVCVIVGIPCIILDWYGHILPSLSIFNLDIMLSSFSVIM